jgi:adenylate cyclase
MFTDMAGYTALGQRNESLSLALVEEQRKLIRPILSRHSGREVKTIGDAFLVEFPSALDAVRCAYDIQRATREFNVSMSAEQRLHLRIGVHVGDVVESQGDISGDAVNVASRIEPLAEVGGVCLSRQVYDHVQNKFDLPLTTLGLKALKNVSVPLEVYKMVMPWNTETAAQLSQLDKNRIAVLPFANMSPDPGDEYFADGMTEEMISTLSTVEGLTVISRTSSMQYKGAKKSLVDIGRELRAGTLLEGSVRKAGNRVRITLQLLDSSEDKHLWAHNYDRDMGDVFAVQSEVAQQVADSLVKGVFQARSREEAPDVQAYTLYMRAKQLLRDLNQANVREALSLFTEAAELDPTFARAFAGIAEAWFSLGIGQYEDFSRVIEKMRPAAKRSLELGPNLAEPHYAMGMLYEAQDLHEEGTLEFKKAVQLNPNLAEAYTFLGVLQANSSSLAEAIEFFEKSLELDPLSINAWLTLSSFKRWAGMKVESFNLLQKTFQLYPKSPATHLWGFATYHMWYDDYPKAQESIDEARALGAEEYDINGPQGILYALTGKKEKVKELIGYYKELMRTNESAGLNGVFQLSAMVGDFDEAFKCLDRMAETGSWGSHVKFSKYLAPLRADPRYLEFCKKVRIPP